jgi:hypothetical protein
MKSQKKIKEYEIDSFEKLVNVVTRENLESLSKDITLWLIYVVEIYEGLRKKNTIDKDKTNWELAKSHFIWVDDGKNDFLTTKVVNELTGEVNTVKIK